MITRICLLAFVVVLNGCSSPAGRMFFDAIGAGGGAVLGHTLSHGNLAATSGGAVAGLLATEGLHYYKTKAETNAWREGVNFGQAQAVKNHFGNNRGMHSPGPAGPLFYVLELFESNIPVLSAIFRSPARPVTPFQSNTGAVSSGRLVGLLDRAKAFLLLQQQHPQLVRDVTRTTPKTQMYYDKILIRVDEVMRLDAEDALVFRVRLSSRTGQQLRYKPDSFAIRVGDRVYPQAISDAEGVIPATGEVTVWFAIQGAPDGQRNDLSLKNLFIVLLTPLL